MVSERLVILVWIRLRILTKSKNSWENWGGKKDFSIFSSFHRSWGTHNFAVKFLWRRAILWYSFQRCDDLWTELSLFYHYYCKRETTGWQTRLIKNRLPKVPSVIMIFWTVQVWGWGNDSIRPWLSPISSAAGRQVRWLPDMLGVSVWRPLRQAKAFECSTLRLQVAIKMRYSSWHFHQCLTSVRQVFGKCLTSVLSNKVYTFLQTERWTSD